MANERFIDIACELADVQCPSDVRREELKKLIKEQFGEDARDEEFYETEAGLVYRLVYEGGKRSYG